MKIGGTRWLLAIMGALATACGGSGDDGTDSGTGAATAVSAPAKVATEYQGTISNLKVFVRLAAQGNAVTGTYFYDAKATAGDVITLKGTLSGSKLKLDESVGTQKTGAWDLTIAGTKITGTFSKPDGSGKLPLTLDTIPSTTLLPVTRLLDWSKSATGEPGKCTMKASYIEVFGMANAAAEKAINDALAEKPPTDACDFPISQDITQTVKMNDSGLFVVEAREEDEGGAHPSVGISPMNFVLATGKQLTGKDIFKPEAMDPLKKIMIDAIDPQITGDDRQTAIDIVNQDVFDLNGFDPEVTKDGLHVDLLNDFPHVALALAPETLIKWSDAKDLLVPGTEVAKLAQ